MDEAIGIANKADVIIVIGTSLQVYPAASLLNYVNPNCDIYLVDPNELDTSNFTQPINHIKEKAGVGLPRLLKTLNKKYEG